METDMKQITSEAGQVLQLFHPDEIEPSEGVYLPALLNTIIARYEFVSVPPDLRGDLTKGIKLRIGHIGIGGRDIAVQEMNLYNDGVLITAKTTTDADLVTDDFLEWIRRTFKLVSEMRKPRSYVSTVVVEFDISLDSAIRSFERISKIFSDALTGAYHVPAAIQLSRLGFAADPETVPHLFNTQFAIERRTRVSYESNRYHCTAPLRTELHLECLQGLEAALASKGGGV
jgi:hypothetical protein